MGSAFVCLCVDGSARKKKKTGEKGGAAEGEQAKASVVETVQSAE